MGRGNSVDDCSCEVNLANFACAAWGSAASGAGHQQEVAIPQQLNGKGPLARCHVVVPDYVSGQIRGYGSELISRTGQQSKQFNA